MEILYQFDDNAITLLPKDEKPSLFRRLLGKSVKAINFNELDETDQDLMIGIADLRAFENANEGSVIFESSGIRLSHDAAASLSARSAQALGLPADVHLILRTDATGLVGHSDFKLRCDWISNGQLVIPKRQGSILRTADGPRRIPLWMKRALDLADGFRAESSFEEHWSSLAEFRRALEAEEEGSSYSDGGSRTAKVAMTAFLKGLTVKLVDRFSISPTRNMTDFDTIPFSGDSLSKLDINNDEVSELDSEIADEPLAVFQHKLHNLGARPAYQLGNNTYLVIDRSAAPVLREIARVLKSPAEERRAFISNPRLFISKAVTVELESDPNFLSLNPAAQEEIIDDVANSRLVETREYSERVTGVEQWTPANTNTVTSGTTWLPEIFSNLVTERLKEMDVVQLNDLLAEMKLKLNSENPEVSIVGEKIDITPEKLIALNLLISSKNHVIENAAVIEDNVKSAPLVLGTLDNTNDLTWSARLTPRVSFLEDTLPTNIKTALKHHQIDSFVWQVSAWRAGLPGILNADEPGLGKTLQTIAFIAWLKEHARQYGSANRGPVLVVAPTSLLVNWEEEVDRHVVEGGFGRLERLYGASTATNKLRGVKGVDTDDGMPLLDLNWLHEAISEGRAHRFWILTTYTTLTNYQHSLGAIPFSVMVCDEMQAVKNENTLRAKAVKAMNVDFRIGLTGTPIENTTIDLWTIMDLLAPGSLGSGTDFQKKYAKPDEENMAELHSRIFHQVEGKPALGIRRTKDEVARDLPQKTRRIHPRLMPQLQASKYDIARQKLAEGGAGAALKMLNHIRSVSVHPGEKASIDDSDFIRASGRLIATFDILDRLYADGERALVFIEHRELQYRFAEIVRQRYRLLNVEIINGDTPILKRQKIVNSFQEHLVTNKGFDLLILGPKAAGTGLTLTAATHVIHLSRWWNPAVEEQCNDRIHRIGQIKPVTIHIPMSIHPNYCEGSFDCLLQSLMQRKRRLARQALWPMGDTSDGPEGLQSSLRSETKVESANPIERALTEMFKRDGLSIPSIDTDGSRVIN